AGTELLVRNHYKELKSIMQKNSKFYTSLLKHLFNKKDKERIRTNLVHFGIVLALLLPGFSAIGIGVHGVFKNTSLDSLNADNRILTEVSAKGVDNNTDAFEAARPGPADSVVPNSGGPANNEADPESVEIENRLAAIQSTSDPMYVPTM